MLLFNGPKNIKFENFHEDARFIFIWRICYLFTIVISGLTTYIYLVNFVFFYYYLLVLSVLVSSLILLWKKRAYKSVAKFLFSSSTGIIALSLFTVNQDLHYHEAVWMVIIILSSFYVINRFWGGVMLAINAVMYAVFFIFYLDTIDVLKLTQNKALHIEMAVELALAMFLIGYVMFQYERLNRVALENSFKALEELGDEKINVENQNREITALLQEIHHRVKNNLQVIISLLRLQSQELKSEEAIEGFQNAISRVMTMSLIHQTLYQSDSLADIDLEVYFKSLIDNLIKTSALHMDVSFQVGSQIKNIASNQMVTIGLIVNELVNNSLKHAFDENGKIELDIKRINRKKIVMTYFDDGTWKESDHESLGMQLIDTFTQQLNGTFTRESNASGTLFEFEFVDA